MLVNGLSDVFGYSRKSISFVSKYSSSVLWKSRWSCVRFVKTPMSNSQPTVRRIYKACDETSIAAVSIPSETILAKSA